MSDTTPETIEWQDLIACEEKDPTNKDDQDALLRNTAELAMSICRRTQCRLRSVIAVTIYPECIRTQLFFEKGELIEEEFISALLKAPRTDLITAGEQQ